MLTSWNTRYVESTCVEGRHHWFLTIHESGSLHSCLIVSRDHINFGYSRWNSDVIVYASWSLCSISYLLSVKGRHLWIPRSHKSDSLRSSLVVSADPKNMAIAVRIALLSCTSWDLCYWIYGTECLTSAHLYPAYTLQFSTIGLPVSDNVWICKESKMAYLNFRLMDAVLNSSLVHTSISFHSSLVV